MKSISLSATALIASCMLFTVVAHPLSLVQREACSALSPLLTDIYTFPLGTWVENIYPRYSSGQYLVSLVTPSPDFYLIDSIAKTASLVATLPNVSSMTGIAQGPRPDTYVVVGTNFSVQTFSGGKGSNRLYTIDMNGCDPTRGRQATVELSLNVPNATTLDGLAEVNPAKGIYVATDLIGGVIYRLDIQTGKSSVIVANQYTAKSSGSIGGANGLKVRQGYLYWTSIGLSAFARVPIDASGYPTGPTEKLADIGVGDDFVFDINGDAYLTQGDSISVLKAGESRLRELPGTVYAATAARFSPDRSSLIISTAGNYSQYAANMVTRPGKVVSLSLPCQN